MDETSTRNRQTLRDEIDDAARFLQTHGPADASTLAQIARAVGVAVALMPGAVGDLSGLSPLQRLHRIDALSRPAAAATRRRTRTDALARMTAYLAEGDPNGRAMRLMLETRGVGMDDERRCRRRAAAIRRLLAEGVPAGEALMRTRATR